MPAAPTANTLPLTGSTIRSAVISTPVRVRSILFVSETVVASPPPGIVIVTAPPI